VIKPALVEATQQEIDMTADELPGGTTAGVRPALQPGFGGEFLKRMKSLPMYIDNDIKEVNYFTAELARIHYRDNTTYDLGLVPRYMQPPVVEVDCHTPLYEISLVEDPTTKSVGFMLQAEMATAPRTMPYSELLKKYVHPLDFAVLPGGRVVPSRINELTAPTLCSVLRSSEARYEEQVQMAVQIGLGGTRAIGPYAGMGGFPKGTGVAATNLITRAAPRVLTPAGKKLWNEFNAILGKGGEKTIEVEGMRFEGVTVAEQGSTLAVRRFQSKAAVPGQGTGARLVRDFEDAAAELGRLNGSKTVTIDVGIITNPGWREFLEARGYVFTPKAGGWVKTIELVHL
jgi:hypothetical protein